MSPPAGLAEFLGLIRKSGLIDEQTLASAAFGLPREPVACADALVEAQLLTAFQAKSLLTGRTRGLVLGPYRVLHQLGKGGMGVVYLAEHAALKRKVALKVLGEEQSREKLALERFFREARAAAALDHPNIVRLHDIAEFDGTHCLVMEFVDGTDLQALIEQTGPLHALQAANYIVQAAAGLQHAHDRGFIHRDIKPANLIVTRSGAVKVLDMGLARSVSDPNDALTGQLDEDVITGTADFLSPEQALNVRLDTRTDIYSLGGTFYTLLTGRPPYEGPTAQKLAQHQTAAALHVRAVRTDVPAELAAVIARMMAKRPGERYQMARDVIAALAPWVPGADSGTAPAASLQAEPAPGARSARRRVARVMRSKGWMAGAAALLSGVILYAAAGGPQPVSDQQTAAGEPAPVPPAPSTAHPPGSEFRWLLGHGSQVNDLVISPDETRLASVDWSGRLIIWDLATGQRLHESPTRPDARCLSCATTPDGRFVLVAGERMPILAFEWATGREVREYTAHEPATWGLAVSPSGRHLLSCGSDGSVVLRSLPAGDELRRFEFEAKQVWTVAFSADGTKFAAGAGTGSTADESYLIRVWATADGKQVHQLSGHTGEVRAIGFRPDGAVLASGGFDGTVRFWDLTAGTELRTVIAHDGVVERVSFLPGGRRLLTCGGPIQFTRPTGEGGAAKLWDADTGREVKRWRGAKWTELISLSPSGHGRFAAAGGRDQNVRVWPLTDGPPDRLVHAFELSRGSAFQSRYQGGQHSQPTPLELTGNGVFLHCWKKESAAEFRGEPDNGRAWLAATNLNDDPTSQIIFQCDDAVVVPLEPGKRYRVRLEYRTTNETEGRMSVRNPRNGDFSALAEGRLDRTDGQWKSAELTFLRPTDGKIDVCVANTATSEGNVLAVRAVEVFETEP